MCDEEVGVTMGYMWVCDEEVCVTGGCDEEVCVTGVSYEVCVTGVCDDEVCKTAYMWGDKHVSSHVVHICLQDCLQYMRVGL